MISRICTKCDGLGVVKVSVERMDPLHNIAVYDRHHIGPNGMIEAYSKQCTCKDGMIEWTRGKSIPPTMNFAL